MERSEENDRNSRHPELWDEPDTIRRDMARTMGHIYRNGMTTTSGGNISVIDSLGNIWITPSGTDKGVLKPEELVCVARDGSFEGALKPSMEYPLHREVYRARPDLRALVHAHPPMLTSFSIVHRIPDTSIVGGWKRLCGTTGYAGYATPGSDTMGEKVASEFSRGHDAVVMENHAVIAGGRNLAEALARLEALEYCARTIHAATTSGEAGLTGELRGENPDLQADSSLPGQTPAPGQAESPGVMTPEEELLGEEICLMTLRACNRGLMYGFSGTVSARSGGERFLITRDRVLRCGLGKQDIFTVRYRDDQGSNELTGYEGGASGINHDEAGNQTSIAVNGIHPWLYGEIYRRFPSINAVITAQPPYLMAFAVTGREIDVKTIPESWLLLRELPSLPREALRPGNMSICEKMEEGSPAVIIRNDSVIVTGESLLQAFDRLEVAEMTAMSLILAQPLGTVQTIREDQIDALAKTFLK